MESGFSSVFAGRSVLGSAGRGEIRADIEDAAGAREPFWGEVSYRGRAGPPRGCATLSRGCSRSASGLVPMPPTLQILGEEKRGLVFTLHTTPESSRSAKRPSVLTRASFCSIRWCFPPNCAHPVLSGSDQSKRHAADSPLWRFTMARVVKSTKARARSTYSSVMALSGEKARRDSTEGGEMG